MIITHLCLHNFMAELWNSAEQTCGRNRFLRPLSCWLERNYEDMPKCMKQEYDRGRIIIYPHFPKHNWEDMEERR